MEPHTPEQAGSQEEGAGWASESLCSLNSSQTDLLFSDCTNPGHLSMDTGLIRLYGFNRKCPHKLSCLNSLAFLGCLCLGRLEGRHRAARTGLMRYSPTSCLSILPNSRSSNQSLQALTTSATMHSWSHAFPDVMDCEPCSILPFLIHFCHVFCHSMKNH